MKRKRILQGLFFVSILLMISIASAQLEPLREQRLKYGPSLYITNVTHPDNIEPGSDAVISFTLENVAPHQLRDIVMQLELPSQFAPKEISKEKIRTLEASSKEEINFEIITLPTTKEGIYEVPVSMSYIDEIGNSYSENNTISIKVSAQPKIFTELTSSTIYEGNLLGRADIKVANKGIGDLKFLVVEILPSQEYEIIGPSKDYVGALNSDDYETVDFNIRISEGKKNVDLLIKLDYSDANNKAYSDNIKLPLKVITSQSAGIKQSNNNLIILIIIVIVVIYFIYRKLKKKTKK